MKSPGKSAGVIEVDDEISRGYSSFHPRQAVNLYGHATAERALLDAWAGGRLPHAWLISGAKGIGKATLAFRFARFLLTGPSPDGDMFGAAPSSLQVPKDDPVFARVANFGHPDLVTVERPWNDKNKKWRDEITVDEVRKAGGFFQQTASGGGWRICIVDAADEMNPNAANALLKMLEEPPKQALLLLVAHAPGSLLPTIRSRCRRLVLQPLAADLVDKVLGEALPDLGETERRSLVEIADGSPGRAVALAAAGGVELHAEIEDLLGQLPRLDFGKVHALADKINRAKGARDGFATLADLLDQWLGRAVKRAALGNARQSRTYLAARDRCRHLFDRQDAVNIEKKQVLLNVFSAIEQAARDG